MAVALRLLHPMVGALIGPWLFFRTESLFPAVAFIMIAGVFLTRAVLAMAAARWDRLLVLEIDWFTFFAAIIIAGAALRGAVAAPIWTLAAIWLAGALTMFWAVFVARAIQT